MTWTLSTFATLVSQMRSAQRDYFRNRKRATPQHAQTLLSRSTWLEREVDKALREIAQELASSLPLFDYHNERPD
jgi:hypothetical protein